MAMTTKKISDRKMEAWIAKQREAYAAGKLSQWKIDMLEKIPGWEWGVEPGKPTQEAIREDVLVRRFVPELVTN